MSLARNAAEIQEMKMSDMSAGGERRG